MAKAHSQKPAKIAARFGEFCERIASGASLEALAKEFGTSATAIRAWIGSDEKRVEEYARARSNRAHKFADEINELADKSVSGAVDPQAARVAIDAKKWLACKMLPRVYGDKLETAITGADGGPLVVEVVQFGGVKK